MAAATSTGAAAAAALAAPAPYYFEDGLRRVAPYFYTYKTWVKERWRGRQLIDVFASEFRDRPLEYYRAALESGKVLVNGKQVGPHHVLKNGELVAHTTHRHEPPVPSDPIDVIHEDEDMMVINKPAGIPVHPAGRYSCNSVVEILKAERGPSFAALPCNRLDRLTSGIMFVAKNAKAAEGLRMQLVQRTVRKEYVARVQGRFPDGDVACDQPILLISPKLGLNRVRASGKPAKTLFRRLAYYPPSPRPSAVTNGDPDAANAARPVLGGLQRDHASGDKGYSIVRCRPLTGRTHQIRVHLQFLGHPIGNDPIYANRRVWGCHLGVSDAEATQNSDEDIIARLSRMGKEEVADAVSYYDEMVDEYHKKTAEKMSGALCSVCKTPLYTDPGPRELVLWLHSVRYEDAEGAWGYTSPLPTWALPPEGVKGPRTVDEQAIVGEALLHNVPTN